MVYEKINWENAPSTNTPINAENLDHMDNGIAEAYNLIGQIIETGSNEDGGWIKFSNGIMIVTKIITINATCNKQWGSMYESENISLGATPQTFIEVPIVFTYASTRTALIEGLRNTTINDFGNTWLARPIADQNQSEYTINLLAIGRWK